MAFPSSTRQDAGVRPAVLRRYWLYAGGAHCVLYSSVFFVYYEERLGLSVAAILALQSYTTALRGALDLPLGGLADRVSRRGCLVWGAACLATGSATLLLFPTLAAAWVAETLMATSTALRSGADSALLYDALDADDRLDAYAFAESRAQAIASVGSGAAAVAGGLLAAIDLRWPYLVTALLAVATGLVAAALPDARPRGAAMRSARPLRESAALVASSPSLLWVVAVVVFAVVASHVYFYLQQPFLREVGVPVALFGVVFAVTKLVTAVVANQAHRADEALGERATAGLMVAISAVGLGGMAVATGPLGALWILTRGLLDGLWMPLANIWVNRRVESRLRATTLSLQSVVGRMVLAAALALMGLVTAGASVTTLLLASAGCVAVVGALLVALRPART